MGSSQDGHNTISHRTCVWSQSLLPHSFESGQALLLLWPIEWGASDIVLLPCVTLNWPGNFNCLSLGSWSILYPSLTCLGGHTLGAFRTSSYMWGAHKHGARSSLSGHVVREVAGPKINPLMVTMCRRSGTEVVRSQARGRAPGSPLPVHSVQGT